MKKIKIVYFSGTGGTARFANLLEPVWNLMNFIDISRGQDVGADLCVCPDMNQCHVVQGEHAGSPLPQIIQWFKQ